MIAKSHGEKSKRNRKVKPNPTGMAKTKEYDRVEETVNKVYCDICNGFSKSDILQKLQEGLYDNIPVKQRQAYDYYNAAMDRLALDSDIEEKEMKNMFYGRYESILKEAIEVGDRISARNILDSMAKIFLQKNDTSSICINGGNDSSVTITFGFNANNDTKASD